MAPPVRNLSGQRFGMLVVKQRVLSARNAARWECECDCGAVVTVVSYNLTSGHSKSCGNRSHRKPRGVNGRRGVHPLSRCYWSMIARCSNPNNKSYKNYGGRGIQVCRRWRASFAAFVADMGERPPNTSIDRIDNDGNYEPGNCRWATPSMQLRNTRRARLFTIAGETLCLTEWARREGIPQGTVHYRVVRRGMSIERALRLSG